jgi:FkbM family methyltransferase
MGLRVLAVARRTLKAIWTHPENRGGRARALGRYFAWQFWERTVRRPWSVELVDGMRIRCHPHSPIASAVLYYGLADPMEMHFLLDFLRTGETFVDVGANVGVYSLLACSVPGVSVLALEPSTAAFDRIRENVALNYLEDRVTLKRVALGRSDGNAKLTLGFDAMNSLVEDESEHAVEPVAVTTLDGVVEGIGMVALVKIDVEGWETEVLEGAVQCLTHQRPALIVEVNDADGLDRIRRRFGYECVVYDPAKRSLEISAISRAKGSNAILVPDLTSARERLARFA